MFRMKGCVLMFLALCFENGLTLDPHSSDHVAQLSSLVVNLSQTVDSLNKNFANLQLQQNTSQQEISTLKTSRQQQHNASQQEISTLKTSLQQQQNSALATEQELSRLKVSCQKSQNIVAFSASMTSYTKLGASQLLEFDHVLTNIGGAYDPRHSHFVAPVKGLYLFTVTVTDEPNNHPRLQIVKNGNQIGHVFVPMNTLDADTGSTTIVVTLEPNDMVWVRHATNDPSSIVTGAQWTSFTGFLINQI